jgi:hypothetical protein
MKYDEYRPKDLYILEGRKFRPAESMEAWGKYMDYSTKPLYYRHVSIDRYIVNENEFCNLSTVFLGIDHNFGFNDPTPVLFESMIFGGEHLDETTDRYRTYEEAEKGHVVIRGRILKLLRLRMKTDSFSMRGEGEKLTVFSLSTTRVKNPVFTENDIRLIRED